jgi:hypothetical protein
VTLVSRFVNLWRIVWWAAATALISFGFAIDGASEPGHHAGLILGGIALGISFRR